MKAKLLGPAAVALALGANAPASAQYMMAPNYPVIVVPPPPAQNLVAPKPPKPAPKPNPPAEAQSPPSEQSQCYSGRTRVCP